HSRRERQRKRQRRHHFDGVHCLSCPLPPVGARAGLRASRQDSPWNVIEMALARPSVPMRNSTGSVGSTVRPVDHVKLSRFTGSIAPFNPPRTACSLPSVSVTVTSPNRLSAKVPTYAARGSGGVLDTGAAAPPRPAPRPPPPPPPPR